ncbi:MAG: hypothetical protein GF350_15235 [Chitinivibrionales bacterium]|nr:hypothetical protein [Chitinivibrionales bacterium]
MKKCRVFFAFIPCVFLLVIDISGYAFNPVVSKNGIIIADTEGNWAYAWPVNCGLWSWGSEAIVHFGRRQWLGEECGGICHERVKMAEGGGDMIRARTTDNGETWSIEGIVDGPSADASYPLDFYHSSFALMSGGTEWGPTYDWFVVSYDRGRTWQGPYDNFPAGENRPDKVFAKNSTTAITNVTMYEGEESPRTLKTTDGGRNWEPRGSWPEYSGDDRSSGGYAIQTNTVRLGENELLAVGRSGGFGALYRSEDFGDSWNFERHVHPEAFTNQWVPCNLVVLGGEYPENTNTDHIVACWVARGDWEKPNGDEIGSGLRVRYSNDKGHSWSDSVVNLRDDIQENPEAWWDIGYPLSFLRTDGKVCVVYYWQSNEYTQPHIAYTIFDPNIDGVSVKPGLSAIKAGGHNLSARFAAGTIVLDLPDNSGYSVIITDLSGQKITSVQTHKSIRAVIPVGMLAQGMYFIEAQRGEKTIRQSFAVVDR